MNIAIIQARAGSKRIPGKNIKDFLGKPIINYSIEAVIGCKDIFDHVIVSTDSEEIANIAKEAGAEVPFLRPKKLANDFANTVDVVEHAISAAEDIYGEKVKNVCSLHATAPFLRPMDIHKGYEMLIANDVSSVFSVTTFPYPILRAQKINTKGHLEMLWPEYELTHSNNLPEAYHDAGLFYWLNVEKFLLDLRMFGKDALPVILPRIIVQDIDTTEDWETAEILYQLCQKKGLL